MTEPFTEFEEGERQALLQVRSFIATHGTKEVGDYCAQRLHDIRMDANERVRRSIVRLPGDPPPKIDAEQLIDVRVIVAEAQSPEWFVEIVREGRVERLHAKLGVPITVPAGAWISRYGPVELPEITIGAGTTK